MPQDSWELDRLESVEARIIAQISAVDTAWMPRQTCLSRQNEKTQQQIVVGRLAVVETELVAIKHEVEDTHRAIKDIVTQLGVEEVRGPAGPSPSPRLLSKMSQTRFCAAFLSHGVFCDARRIYLYLNGVHRLFRG